MPKLSFLVIVCFTLCYLHAQPPVPSGPTQMTTVSPDHYFLNYAFGLDHNKKAKDIATTRGSNKSKGDAMEEARRLELGLSSVDLNKIDKAFDKLEQDAKVIENKMRSHLDDAKAKKQEKDRAYLRKLESERYATVAKTLGGIYQSLTPEGAIALRRYINQIYRRNLLTPANQ